LQFIEESHRSVDDRGIQLFTKSSILALFGEFFHVKKRGLSPLFDMRKFVGLRREPTLVRVQRICVRIERSEIRIARKLSKLEPKVLVDYQRD